MVTGGGFFLTSTLAANLSLSSGGVTEFGQSVSQTVACSGASSLKITPASSFVNISGSTGTYYLNSVSVSGIPSTCDGVDFSIRAFGSSSSTPLNIFNTSATVAVVNDVRGTGFRTPYSSTVATVSGTSTEFTLTFVDPVAISGAVSKLTLQSGDHIATCAEGGTCLIGDMGPGGGTVFYVSTGFTESGTACNTSCRYLEAAPTTGTNAWTDLSSNWSAITNQSVGTTSELLGYGKQNTQAMYTQSSSAGYPAALSIGYRGPNNYSDWFVPSLNEFVEMGKAKKILGFKPTPALTPAQPGYWTSSEPATNSASKATWFLVGNLGFQSPNKSAATDGGGTVPVYSRAIRAF